MSYIIFNGKKSTDFNLRLENNITFPSTKTDISFEKIRGLDGEVAITDNTLMNTYRSFPFVLNSKTGKNIDQITSDISNWLLSDGQWHDLYFDGDSLYMYKAIVSDEYEVERMLNFYGKVILKFIIKPYKYLKTGLDEIAMPSTITNPTARVSKPIIKIKGSGDITLTIGSSALRLKGVVNGVLVDSLTQTITTLDGRSTLFNQMISYPFPSIAPGNQTITTSGTITECKIIPRWEVIV